MMLLVEPLFDQEPGSRIPRAARPLAGAPKPNGPVKERPRNYLADISSAIAGSVVLPEAFSAARISALASSPGRDMGARM